jgi:hypothetical protein
MAGEPSRPFFEERTMDRWSCVLLGGLVATLGSGLALAGGQAGDDDVAPDVPVRVETGLFYPPVRLSAADGVIDCGAAWGHASPWVVDVDGDGVNDLVVGDFSGFFHFYRNTGTNREPRYAKAVNLKAGGVDAQVPIY